MSGLVARRNDVLYWYGRVEWLKVTGARKPVCDDCLLAVHDSGGVGALHRATWRRVSDFASTQLCARHRKEWDTWTPGQMELL